MSTKTCRICGAPAEFLARYVVEHNDARVEHLTCEKHTEPLRRDMVEAGWTLLAIEVVR